LKNIKRILFYLVVGILTLAHATTSVFAAGSTAADVKWGDIRTYTLENMENLDKAIDNPDNPLQYSTTTQSGRDSTKDSILTSIYGNYDNDTKQGRFSTEYSGGYFSPQPGREMAAVSSYAVSQGVVSLFYSWNESATSSYWYSNTYSLNFTNTSENENYFMYYKKGAFYNGEYYDVKVNYWMESTEGISTFYRVWASGSVQAVISASGDTARQSGTLVHMKMYFYKSNGAAASKVKFTDSTEKCGNGNGYKVVDYTTVPSNSQADEFKGVTCITDMDAGEGVYFKSGVEDASHVYLAEETFIRRVHDDTDMHGTFNEYFNKGYSSTLDVGSLYGVFSQNYNADYSTLLSSYVADGLNTNTYKFPLTSSSSTVPSTLKAGYNSGLLYVSSFSNVSADSNNCILGNTPESMSMWAEFSSSASEPTEMIYFTPSSRGADVSYRGVDINYVSVVADNDCLSSSATKQQELATDYAAAYGSYSVENASSAYNQAVEIYGSDYAVQGIYLDSALTQEVTDLVYLENDDITLYVKITPTYAVYTYAEEGATITASKTDIAEGTDYKVEWKAKDGYVISDVKIYSTPTINAKGNAQGALANSTLATSTFYKSTSGNSVTSGSVVMSEKDEPISTTTVNSHRKYTVHVYTVPLTTATVTNTYSYEVPVTFNLTKKDSGDSSILLQGATYSLSPYKALSGSTSYTAVSSAKTTATTTQDGTLSSTMSILSGTSPAYSQDITYIESSNVPTSFSSTVQKTLFTNAYKNTYTESTVRSAAASKNLSSFNTYLTNNKIQGTSIKVNYTETAAPAGYELNSTTKTSSNVTVGSFSLDSDGIYRPTTALVISATDTNTPTSGTRQYITGSAVANVSIPVTFTLTKKDTVTNDTLAGADFTITSAITSNNSGVNLSMSNTSATATTDSNGKITYTTNLTGNYTNQVTYYYYDLDSLYGSAKTAAQKDIADNANVFSTKSEAESAAIAQAQADRETQSKKLSDVIVVFTAKETKAPTGYTLPSNTTTTKSVSVGDLTFTSSKNLYSASPMANATVTNQATAGTTATTYKSQSYTYEIPTSLVITKTDASTGATLQNAIFSVTSTATDSTKTLTSGTTNTQSVTTNSSGKATYSNTLSGTFTLTTQNYTYYTDYSSLKGSALNDANAAINNTTVFKTQAEAESAASSELSTLLTSKQADLKKISVVFTVNETTAPTGYTLDTATKTTNNLTSSSFTVSGTKLTGSISDTLAVTDTATGGSLDVLAAQTKEYTYTIPVSITLTKKDSATSSPLANATFTVLSKYGTESYGNSVSKTTNSNGLLTATRDITGTVSVTTSAYLYYTDYDSLVSSAKTEADKKIANGEAYKTKADAQAAANASLPDLLKSKLESTVSNQAIQAKATETKAPDGYTIDSITHESSKVYPSTYTLSGTTATYSTVSVDIGTVTNEPTSAAIAQIDATTKTYTYSIPLSITLTKKDASTSSVLQGATFDITTKASTDSAFTRKQSKTTNANGTLSATDTVTGTFSVTSKAYKYYVDYASLVSSVKTEADKKIASGEMYKDETSARAAMLASLPVLAEEYLTTNISTQGIQAQAVETAAPDGYTLDTTAHVSSSVKPTTYTLSDTTFTYDTVTLSIGTVTNEPKGAATSTLPAVTQEYSYKIPMQVSLTKKDSSTDAILQGATFDITTKTLKDSAFARTQSKTTDDKGILTATDSVSGTFTITSSSFKYYDDYDSLVSTVKAEADKKIAAKEVYKTKADAQAAQTASLPILAQDYLTTNISTQGIQAQAIETAAPDGYELDSTTHISATVKPSTYSLNGTSFTYDTVDIAIGTVMNEPKGAATSTLSAVTQQYSYTIPLTVTLTKKDADTDALLEGATFDITTKGSTDTDFTRKQSKTTDAEGVLSATDNINGTFKITSSTYKYYDDYDSLVSTVKEEADKKIAAKEVYKTKADAEAAQSASLPVLAKEYLESNISTKSIQAQAIETEAPDGYELDSTSHVSSEVTPSVYSLTDSLFTYDTLVLDIGTVTNSPKKAAMSTLDAVTTTYSYTIPMSVNLTKKDSTTDILLADANYTVSTKTLKDSDFARSQQATTSTKGTLTVTDSISGTFDVTTSSYKYYDNYDSLVSTIKEEADKKIAAKEVYKTKADAQAAQAASIPVLAKNYLTTNISSKPIQAQAVETKAPGGYVLDETEHISQEVTPTTYTLENTTFTYDTVNLSLGTLTNEPKQADVSTLKEVTTTYTYTIPMSVTLTKKDSTSDILLEDVSYTLSTQTLLDTDFSRTQVSKTNENGVLTIKDSVSGEFDITTASYKYYSDYESLVGAVKEEADNKIAANEIYKNQEEAQAALEASLPVLAKLYLETNISSKSVQATATEIKAPEGYVLDSEVHFSSKVNPTTYSLSGTTFTYDTVSLNLGNLTNTPKPAVVNDLEAQTKEYTYVLPIDIQLTNQDVDTEEPLADSEFHITSETSQIDNSFAETYDETTDENGTLSVSREITDEFSVTTSKYKYYDDYDSLVSTVKEEADKKIANNEIYSSQESAQAALEAEQNKLAEQYMNKNISTITLQSTAKQTKAAAPYVLNTETYALTDVNLTDYTFDEDTATFTYEMVVMDYEVVNNLKYSVELVNLDNELLEGAEFEIQDTEGNVIDSWVSSTESHVVPNLTANETYTLVETKAPKGYVLANPTTFETTAEHNTTITIVNGKYSVSLLDENEATIEGATFQLLDEEGNVLEEWVSTEDVYIPDSLTVGKTYTIVETYTPTGFNQMPPYTFTVENENGAIVLNNSSTSVYKKTSTGASVQGAELQIQDEEGNVLDSWTSGQQIVSLEDAVYKEADENGVAYIVKPEVVDNETEELVEEDTTSEDESNTSDSDSDSEPTILMQKLKTATLEGAYTLITEYSDNTWTYQEIDSQGVELGHRASLVSDATYTLVETKAPEGFELASNISFIAKGNTDYSITMIDEYKVEAAIHKLATGIHSNITYIAVGFAAIVILIVVLVLRKKKHTASN
jgi:uncharacterized surface anchored protein